GQSLLDGRCCSHRNWSHDGKNRRLGNGPRDAQYQISEMLVSVLSQENYLRLARKRFNVGRVCQAAGAHVAANDFRQILFMERDIALRHVHHARTVRMAAGYWRSEIGQAS